MNRKPTIVLLLLALGLTGCATPLQLVNAFGDHESCRSNTQYGFLGTILPNRNADDCKKALTQLGYLPEAEAGTIDINLTMDGGNVVASSLPDTALQQQPDLETGDKILSVDGKSVDSIEATTTLLFGPIGSTATIVFGRGTMEFPVQLIRHPINEKTPSKTTAEVIPLTINPYSIESNPSEQKATTPKDKRPSFLQTIKTMFSSIVSPHTNKAPAKESNATIPESVSSPSTKDHYSAAEPISEKKTLLTPETTIDRYSTHPIVITPPPLIMIGDQVCRARKHFIDIGNVEDVRADRILVTIDHIQLIRAPYTEFHHFGQRKIWNPIKAWKPCSGDAPLFLNRP